MTPSHADRPPGRLRSSSRVSAVMGSGRRRASGTIVLHVADGDAGVFRFTAVASRRVGSAVRRNRAKRLMREAVRSLTWCEGVDAALVARPSIVGAPLGIVRGDVQRAGRDLGVLV